MILGSSLGSLMGTQFGTSLAGGDTPPVPKYTLTFSGAHGTISATVDGVAVTSPAQVAENASVILTAIPDSGYEFSSWSGTHTSSSATLSFSMPNTAVTDVATFVYNPTYTLYFHASSGAHVSQSTFTGHVGDTVSVSVTFDTHYSWYGWSDGPTDNPRTFTIAADATYTAIATRDNQYTLTFAATNGSVSQSTFTGYTGDTIQITVTPDSGYDFSQWNDGDTNNPRTFSVGSASVTYTASCIEPVVADYLCFTANTAGSTVQLKQNGTWSGTWPIETSTDNVTWTSYTLGTDITLTNVGDKIYFRGTKDSTAQSSSIYRQFVMTGSIASRGDVTSLLNGNGGVTSLTSYGNQTFRNLFKGCTSLTTAPSLPATTLSYYGYASMFQGCTALTTAPSLPATTLAEVCYYRMFEGCTSLTTAPSTLPATTLSSNCYQSMFYGCTSLTSAPSLPATTLAQNCYRSMFEGCTSLTTAPSTLPATTLSSYCYQSMFYGCTSLTSAPSLPATTLSYYGYYYMFYGCTALTTAPSLPATSLVSYCYNYMFQGCTHLEGPINISATTSPSGNYTGGMFTNSGTSRASGASNVINVPSATASEWNSTNCGIDSTYWTVVGV